MLGALSRSNFRIRPVKQLVELLSHPDRRIRQKAQFTLVDRSADAALIKAAVGAENRLTRIHAIWAIGQIARREPLALNTFVGLLDDPAAEIRAQAVRILGDCHVPLSVKLLGKRLTDESARVRSLAAVAFSRLRLQNVAIASHVLVKQLCRMLSTNNDKDPVVRHSAVLALSKRVTSSGLVMAGKGANSAVRMGITLALRLQKSKELAKLVDDPEPSIVFEAALSYKVAVNCGTDIVAASATRPWDHPSCGRLLARHCWTRIYPRLDR